MSADWNRIESLFDQALGIPIGQRSAFVARACRSDKTLRGEVLSLLKSHEQGDAFLENAAFAPWYGVLRAVEEDSDELLGLTLGQYRIERRIGAGGMGTVYAASRIVGDFEQRVAIKVVKRGMDTEQIRTRFFAERRVLASLSHPGIAHLLDGGVTPDHRPYYVMELIDGTSLIHACDDSSRSISQRIEIFTKVCDAVSYAHKRLVVHRDLKPGNILLDSDANPMLLDFGIAKLLSQESNAEHAATAEASRMLTPAYASPEQIAGAPASTACDIYSLGAILFELLSGRQPPNATTPQDSLDKRSVPVRLSGSVQQRQGGDLAQDDAALGSVNSGSHATSRAGGPPAGEWPSGPLDSETIARCRGIKPPQLARRLRGDLENIVAKAMHLQPERRYASVDDLAADLRRYLNAEPVNARPDGLAYRTQRFLSKHYIATVLVASSALLFVVAGMIAFWQWRVASLNLIVANQVTSTLTGIYSSFDPAILAKERGNVPIDDFLAYGARKAREDHSDQPTVLATILTSIASAYLNLGKLDAAVELIQESLELERRDTSNRLLQITSLEIMLSHALTNLGRLSEGRSTADIALDLALRTYGETGRITARARAVLALNHIRAERFDDSSRELDRAFAALSHADSSDPQVMSELASIMKLWAASQAYAPNDEHANRNLERARATVERALDLERQFLPPTHPSVLRGLHQLGTLCYLMGDLDRAESTLRECLAARKDLFDPKRYEIGLTSLMLAKTLFTRGQFEEAEVYASDAAGVFAHNFPRIGEMEHWKVADARSVAALAIFKIGRWRDAERIATLALAALDTQLGEGHEHTIEARERLVQIYEESGQHALADCQRARVPAHSLFITERIARHARVGR